LNIEVQTTQYVSGNQGETTIYSVLQVTEEQRRVALKKSDALIEKHNEQPHSNSQQETTDSDDQSYVLEAT